MQLQNDVLVFKHVKTGMANFTTILGSYSKETFFSKLFFPVMLVFGLFLSNLIALIRDSLTPQRGNQSRLVPSNVPPYSAQKLCTPHTSALLTWPLLTTIGKFSEKCNQMAADIAITASKLAQRHTCGN